MRVDEWSVRDWIQFLQSAVFVNKQDVCYFMQCSETLQALDRKLILGVGYCRVQSELPEYAGQVAALANRVPVAWSCILPFLDEDLVRWLICHRLPSREAEEAAFAWAVAHSPAAVVDWYALPRSAEAILPAAWFTRSDVKKLSKKECVQLAEGVQTGSLALVHWAIGLSWKYDAPLRVVCERFPDVVRSESCRRTLSKFAALKIDETLASLPT